MNRTRSIQFRLTLITTLVIWTGMLVFGVTMRIVSGISLHRSVDRQLEERAQEFSVGVRSLILQSRERSNLLGGPQGPPLLPTFRSNVRPRVLLRGTPLPGFPVEVPLDADAANKAQSGKPDLRTIQLEGEPTRLLSAQVPIDRQTSAVLQLPYPLQDVQLAMKHLEGLLLAFLPISATAAWLISLYLVPLHLRPMTAIRKSAEQIGANNPSARVSAVSADEYGELAKTLNRMLDRLEQGYIKEREVSETLARSVETHRRFTADASHELKTPLAIIKAHIALIRLEGEAINEDVVSSLISIDEAAERMDRLVRDLLTLAKTDASEVSIAKEPCLVQELLGQAIRRAHGVYPQVQLEGVESDLVVLGHFQDLLTVFVNLITNARMHSQATEIRVAVAETDVNVVIEVIDNGIGIAAEHLPFLFDRFYRIDESRSGESGGNGLGLSICKSIIELHLGSLEAISQVGQGTRFRVTLPRALPLALTNQAGELRPDTLALGSPP